MKCMLGGWHRILKLYKPVYLAYISCLCSQSFSYICVLQAYLNLCRQEKLWTALAQPGFNDVMAPDS